MLAGKRFIIGITGSIAAYKAAVLVRLLVKHGAEVKVVMTPLAKEFIKPLTLATLSRNPVLIDFFNPENGTWNSHVDLGIWADAMIVAPATANTIAKMANGIADNLLLTLYLSARCPIFIAPAMDLDMYQHITVQQNLKKLESYNNIIIEPASGELASGLEGKGRMEEPEIIVEHLLKHFTENQKFKEKKVIITAGPTYEHIDPVRYIGNYSSGKMGFALAEKLASEGAKVCLISGPVKLSTKHVNIERVNVTSALEMYDEVSRRFSAVDIAIMAAAVADYRPEIQHEQKIKHSEENISIQLIPNKDIALEMGKIKRKEQIMIGFALESENNPELAKAKLIKKNFDFIVFNTIAEEGAGFNTDTNKITIIDSNNKTSPFPLKSKQEVATDIVNYIYNITLARK